MYDYRQQGQLIYPGQGIPGFPNIQPIPTQQLFPGYGDNSIERRLNRIERRLDRHTQRLNRLNRRVTRIEQRLNLGGY